MDFDFYQYYQSLGTVELLKVLDNTDDYQPGAIEAVRKILTEREITENDRNEASAQRQQVLEKERKKQEAIDAYKEKAADFLQPLIKPGPGVTAEKWLNILLLFIALRYLWSFYHTIRSQIYFFRNCINCSLDILQWFQIANLIYVPVVFYLLLKRKRWGWILLFGDQVISFILGIGNLYIFFKHFAAFSNGSEFLPMIIEAVFIFFLWRKPIAILFGVSENAKKDTLILSCMIAIAFVFLLMFSTM